jgi:hypothetical protein
MCGGRLRSDGRTGKPVPRWGNPSVRLATRNVVQPVSLLLWCLGATDHEGTGRHGAVGELQHMVEVSQQTCRSRRPWCLESVASRAAGRWLTPEAIEARHRCPAMRPVRRRMVMVMVVVVESVGDKLSHPEMCHTSVVNWARKSRWLNRRGEH